MYEYQEKLLRMKREKRLREKTGKTYPRTVGQWQKCNICIMGILEGEEKGTEEIFEAIMTDNAPKLMSDFEPRIQEV